MFGALTDGARRQIRRIQIGLFAARLRALIWSVLGAADADSRFCPVCGRSSPFFRPFGIVPRDDAQCIHCRALERHRLLWLYMSTQTHLFDGSPKKMLHVAPEPCLEPHFRERLDGGYVTADLLDTRAMVTMDITNIQFPAETFDVIYCSHVLEHVVDDRKAMREFHRVLKTSGWAILLVPITVERTYEDPSIVEPQARLQAFGQEDHVRRYGIDYVDRLRDAGFSVQSIKASEFIRGDQLVRMGLMFATDEIFYCTKPPANEPNQRFERL